jgi:hypothetical protein
MLKRVSLLMLIGSALVVAGCGSTTHTSTHSTAIGSARGWFAAINAHNRRMLLLYVAPIAKDQMGWALPSEAWPKFTDLNCKLKKVPAAVLPEPDDVDVRCTFHESAAQTEGEPSTMWDVYLHQSGAKWLIDSYGEG